jgi:hypothetical protein
MVNSYSSCSPSFTPCQVIEGYSSWLENRVVSRFDAAIGESNYGQQAQVVTIMTELDKEKSIAKVRPTLCSRVLCSGRCLKAICPCYFFEWLVVLLARVVRREVKGHSLQLCWFFVSLMVLCRMMARVAPGQPWEQENTFA